MTISIDPRPFFAAGFRVGSIKTWPGREGGGFRYKLYDGPNAVANVRQDGNGGPTDVDWIGLRWDGSPCIVRPDAGEQETQAMVRAAAISSAAKTKLEGMLAMQDPIDLDGAPHPIDLEWIAAALLDHAELLKRCRSKTCFRRPNHEGGDYAIVDVPYGPDIQAWLDAEHPGSVVLNTWVEQPVEAPAWKAPQMLQEASVAPMATIDLDALIASVVGS